MDLKVYSFFGLILTISRANGKGSWPRGTYGLPKAKSGCPDNKIWKEGWRKQDLDIHTNTSSNIHMDVQLVVSRSINRTFCVKAVKDTGIKQWPQGFYCIYKAKDKFCPTGMGQGALQWADRVFANENQHGGTLPDGVYNSNTQINYCCQNKGRWFDPIELPVARPFYLLPHNNSEGSVPRCQLVKWAIGWLEYIDYDTEDKTANKSYGDHVYFERIRSRAGFPIFNSNVLLRVHYCYYEGCRYKLNSNEGILSFPNSNALFDKCSLSLHVEKSHVILIKFTNIQRLKCEESYLAVYDGTDEESPLLQKYCDSETQNNLILSSGNQVLVIVKQLKLEKAFSNQPNFEVKYSAQLQQALGPTLSSRPTNQSVTVEPRNETSSSKTGLIASLVVVSILFLMLVLLVILRAKVIQCLKTHCSKGNAQIREQTEMSAKPTIDVITLTKNREVTAQSNNLAKPSLDYVNVIGEQNSDECYYTDLSKDRELENVYQSLEHQGGGQEPANDQSADYYVNIA